MEDIWKTFEYFKLPIYRGRIEHNIEHNTKGRKLNIFQTMNSHKHTE